MENFIESSLLTREKVCDVMDKNTDIFGKNKDGSSKEEFLRDINLLKTSGEWNLEIADIVPLTVVNIKEGTLRINSNSVSTQVIEIKPEQAINKILP